MEQRQNPTGGIASQKNGKADITISRFPEINKQAVAEIGQAQTFERVEQIMANALSQAATKYGRPLTYAEMRAEFG